VLEIAELSSAELADPFLGALESSGDAGAYGRAQAGFMEGFLRPSFRTALTGRGDTDVTAILDGIFADTAARIAADPRSVSPTYRLVVGRIARTA
jgi:hypothetical protein